LGTRTAVTRRRLAYAVIAVLAASLAAAGLLLLRGDRYRLYTSAQAAHCWNAVRALAPASSSLRVARIDVRDDAGPADVVIGYRMDRVLGGLELEARCRYPEGAQRASSILLGGEPL